MSEFVPPQFTEDNHELDEHGGLLLPEAQQVNEDDNLQPPTGKRYEQPAMFYAEERDRLQKELHEAKIDPVTGLPNRNAFEEEYPRYFIDDQVAEKRGGIDELTVLAVDLNGLKRVNNHGGEPLGDVYLKAVSERLRIAIRPTDKIFRTGGDELKILLPTKLYGQQKEALISLIARLKSTAIEASLDAGIPQNLYPGVCIGSAVRRNGDTPDDLIKMSDLSMKTDKERFYTVIEHDTGLDLRR